MVKSHETIKRQITKIVAKRPLEGCGSTAGRTISLEEIRHVFLLNGWSPYRETWKKAVRNWEYFGYCTIDEKQKLARFHCNEYGEYRELEKYCNPELLEGSE